MDNEMIERCAEAIKHDWITNDAVGLNNFF